MPILFSVDCRDSTTLQALDFSVVLSSSGSLLFLFTKAEATVSAVIHYMPAKTYVAGVSIH